VKGGITYKCISTHGHIREIADGLNDIQFSGNNNIQIKFSFIKEKRAHINLIRGIIRNYQSSQIILATDDDREGEAIAWHICQVFDMPVDTTPRIIFHEITAGAVRHAIENPRQICMQTVAAQHARQVMDILVGYTVSPYLWSNIQTKEKRVLSAGRCQTPALRLVYDHHIAPKPDTTIRYEIAAHFMSSSNPVIFTTHPPDNIPIPELFEISRDLPHKLTVDAPTSESIRRSPKPLNTSRILQHASNILHTSPKQTMELCQELYQQGFITYLRTESTKYSADFIAAANDYVAKSWGAEFIHPDQTGITLNTAKNDTPHEAIRVVRPDITHIPRVDKIPKLHLMYRLIWERTMESIMADARYEVMKLYMTTTVPAKEEVFTMTYGATLEIPTFIGWQKVSPPASIAETSTKIACVKSCLANPAATYIPYFMETVAHASGVPRPHYSESSLIQHLEEYGIGRPSTYAAIIHTLLKRGYVSIQDVPGVAYPYTHYMANSRGILESKKEIMVGQEKQKFVIQPIGLRVMDYLINNFNHLFEYDYTRRMELALDEVDESTWEHLCVATKTSLSKEVVVSAVPDALSISVEENAHRPPPVPENILRYVSTDVSIRSGKYGPYVYCKTSKMKKPVFYPLAKFKPNDYMTCEPDELLKWLKDTFGRTFS
jgi:DNA topoisomerase-1